MCVPGDIKVKQEWKSAWLAAGPDQVVREMGPPFSLPTSERRTYSKQRLIP